MKCVSHYIYPLNKIKKENLIISLGVGEIPHRRLKSANTTKQSCRTGEIPVPTVKSGW